MPGVGYDLVKGGNFKIVRRAYPTIFDIENVVSYRVGLVSQIQLLRRCGMLQN